MRPIPFLSAALMFVALPTLAAPLAIDTGASSVGVTFTQMNVPVDASFRTFEAKADFDPAQPAAATARIVIETASFDFGPGAEEYNAEVRKSEWFDAARFPQAVFEGAGAKALGAGRYELPGQLTIKGVTKPTVAPIVFEESGTRWVFTGTVPVSRLAFGLGADEWKDTSIVADEVLVKFRLEAPRP